MEITEVIDCEALYRFNNVSTLQLQRNTSPMANNVDNVVGSRLHAWNCIPPPHDALVGSVSIGTPYYSQF